MKYLRHWRERAGLTQEELAQTVEVATRTVNRWENDIREPRAPDIKKLCSVLKVSEVELLNGPQSKEISVTLKIGKLEEMSNMVIDMNNTNGFGLVLDTAKGVGIAGIAQFDTEEQLEETIAKIARLLRKGWKTQQED